MTKFLFGYLNKRTLLRLLYCCSALCSTTIFSCSSDTGDDVIATYKGEKLTRNKITKVIPKSLSKKDSAIYAEQFIEQWKREQIMFDAASREVSESDPVVVEMLQQYKSRLITHLFQNKLIKEHLDTAVSKSEIIEYYKINVQQFISEKNLYHFKYIKTKDPNNPQLYDRLASKYAGDTRVVSSWCKTHATKYKIDSMYLDEDAIIKIERETGYFGLKDLPPGYINAMITAENNDKFFHYFVIIDVVKSGKYIPLIVVEKDIKRTILNNRMEKVLKEYEKKAVNDAVVSKDFIRETPK